MIKLKSLIKEQSEPNNPNLTLIKVDIDVNDNEVYIIFDFKVHNFQYRLIDITNLSIRIELFDLEDYDSADEFLEDQEGEIGYWTASVKLNGYMGRETKAIPNTAMPDFKSTGPGFVWYRNQTSNDIILPKLVELLNTQQLVPGLTVTSMITSEYGMQDDEWIHADVEGEYDKTRSILQKYFAQR